VSLPRLICLPYAGGSRHVFTPWQSALECRIELVTPELPGRGYRIMEPPFNRLVEVIDWLMDELGDYLADDFSLWGHSMGALLAYELSHAVARRTGQQPRHLFVTGALPPPFRRRAESNRHLDDDKLIANLALMNGTPAEVLANRELMALLLPCIRADFAVCDTYVWHPRPDTLQVPITAVGGDCDPDVALEKLQGWRTCTQGETRVIGMKGDHFFLRNHVDSLAELFLETLLSPASLRELA
jgi:medium-chain acyl-[acyl-carrier-protein] hydrolase